MQTVSSTRTPSDARRAISGPQCRAARGLLGWTLDDLATRSEVTRITINKFENGKTLPYADTIAALRACFEAEGIQFTSEPGREGVSRRV